MSGSLPNFWKGQCHEILTSGFFSWISCPQTPDYPIRGIFNFFKNSRRYSQLKVHHQQMEKSSIRKNFIVLFGHLWVVDLTYRKKISLKFTLRYKQSDIVPNIFRWCRWHLWQIYRCCCWYRWHLPLASLTLAANMLPVLLKPVANLPPVTSGTSSTSGRIYCQCCWH